MAQTTRYEVTAKVNGHQFKQDVILVNGITTEADIPVLLANQLGVNSYTIVVISKRRVKI
jgi:hypothetical protein